MHEASEARAGPTGGGDAMKGMARRYALVVRGPIPAGLAEKISMVHASAVLQSRQPGIPRPQPPDTDVTKAGNAAANKSW